MLNASNSKRCTLLVLRNGLKVNHLWKRKKVHIRSCIAHRRQRAISDNSYLIKSERHFMRLQTISASLVLGTNGGSDSAHKFEKYIPVITSHSPADKMDSIISQMQVFLIFITFSKMMLRMWKSIMPHLYHEFACILLLMHAHSKSQTSWKLKR